MTQLTVEPTLRDIFRIEVNLVVCSIQVNFGEVVCSLELLEEFEDDWKRIDIFDRGFI